MGIRPIRQRARITLQLRERTYLPRLATHCPRHRRRRCQPRSTDFRPPRVPRLRHPRSRHHTQSLRILRVSGPLPTAPSRPSDTGIIVCHGTSRRRRGTSPRRSLKSACLQAFGKREAALTVTADLAPHPTHVEGDPLVSEWTARGPPGQQSREGDLGSTAFKCHR